MQRQGIGSALVRHGLGSARQAGHHIVIVVGNPGYYARFGFISASRKGLEPPFPVPDDAFMVLELTKEALKDITGTVRYPAVFNAVSGPDD
jgi:putative acetyltransferase